MTDALRLQFHHNVIEHLGLRLYQNKADKVLCELVSNSWDADAENVRVDLESDEHEKPISLVVMDDGVGMNRRTLQDAFLTIAAPRRAGQNDVARSPGNRLLMGRKGIGKLAPFGICSRVDVLTGSAAHGFTWISLDLEAIQKVSPAAGDSVMGSYEPEVIASAAPLAELGSKALLPGVAKAFVDFISSSQTGSGTAIVLTKISERAKLSPAGFRRALASRFTVTLAREDFRVLINGAPITADEALPPFVFRIPEEGSATGEVGGLPVDYWIGFTERPVSRGEESGVGVYAHGKIAQERPFSFELTGNDLYLPYVYGVVEADWLDDFSEDLISTDRSSIDWDHPQAALLKAWGQKELRRWIGRFQEHRQAQDAALNERAMELDIESGTMPRLTRVEQKSLVTLLSDVSHRLPPDHESRSSMASALARAWLHTPAKSMIQELWQKLRSNDGGAEGFVSTLESIREYSVPEALSASVTFAQRAFALTVLYELIHLGKEPDLQRLIEAFPWIVGPETEYLTANQTLKTVTLEAKDRGLFARDSDRTPVTDSIKPDFVFLSDTTEENIIVVELKSPREDLTLENREQLSSYLTFLEHRYPNAKRKGILIGNSGGLDPRRDDIEIRSWAKVFLVARSAYTKILASMLSGYAEDADDPRITDVHMFGGPEVWELLKNLAAHDDGLRRLIAGSEHAQLLNPPEPVLKEERAH